MVQPSDSKWSSTLRFELEVAEEAARAAGAYLRSHVGHVTVTSKKDVHDDQLDADLEAERMILTYLSKYFPDDSYLSEEAGVEKHDPHRTWFVDPLDGSGNFQHGSPMFGVAICLSVSEAPAVGVIYLPKFDEMYCAVRGAGSMMNGVPIRASDTKRLDDAIIHVGDFATTGRREDNEERIAVLAELASTGSRVRMVGSAAADFAFLACGRADGLIMSNAHPWDIEAGRLLLNEAGGATDVAAILGTHQYGLYGNREISKNMRQLVRPNSTVE